MAGRCRYTTRHMTLARNAFCLTDGGDHDPAGAGADKKKKHLIRGLAKRKHAACVLLYDV